MINRPSLILWLCMLAVAMAAACKAVVGVDPPPPPYTPEDYLSALENASLQLRGRLPSEEEREEVRARRKLAYEQLIDEFLDPAATPELTPQLRGHFLQMFQLPDEVADVGGTPVNYAEPANLATHLVVEDKSFGELVTATYCVDDDLEEIGCTGGSPFPSGILTSQALLEAYGGQMGFRRVSVMTQLTQCKVIPDDVEQPLRECNNCGSGGGGDVFPVDDPSTPPRLHKKYQGTNGPGQCAGCHSPLSARRLVYAKYDDDGIFDPNRIILDMETPARNEGKCYANVPGFSEPGSGGTELTPCCTDYGNPATCLTPAEAMAQPGGCCHHPYFYDYHAYDAIECTNPSADCTGLFYDSIMNKPGDWGKNLLDIPEAGFYGCMTRRFFAFALAEDPGLLGLAEASGSPPAPRDADVLADYTARFEESDWHARELLREIFKGDEYLTHFKH